MEIKSINSKDFGLYGYVVEGDFSKLIAALAKTPCPGGSITYKASEETLEATPDYKVIQVLFGGMECQAGYCNGYNLPGTGMTEYHIGSEFILAENDLLLDISHRWEIDNGVIYASKFEVFRLCAGQAVMLYETTLHHAPRSDGDNYFRSVVGLLKGTNVGKPDRVIIGGNGVKMTDTNKWLLPITDDAK
jgi:xylulokinase